jgi:release factor glutamine methyltransferase
MLRAMEPRTVADAIRSCVSRLGAFETAKSDADELVSRLVGVGRGDLKLQQSRVLTPDEWRQLDSWLRRRASGEPVQYITGRAAFRDLDLDVGGAVLIPRPETELLVESVLAVLREQLFEWPAPRVLDLGTGSGAIALALASEWKDAIVTATDASDEALEVARANARRLGLEARVEFRIGEWFDAVGGDDRFEVVVSNPPYIATTEAESLPGDVRNFEPGRALYSGESGLDALREIVEEAPRHLVTGGLLALELDETRAGEVAAWFEGAHDWSGVDLKEDLAGKPRILVARRERGPAIAPAQWGEERQQ